MCKFTISKESRLALESRLDGIGQCQSAIARVGSEVEALQSKRDKLSGQIPELETAIDPFDEPAMQRLEVQRSQLRIISSRIEQRTSALDRLAADSFDLQRQLGLAIGAVLQEDARRCLEHIAGAVRPFCMTAGAAETLANSTSFVRLYRNFISRFEVVTPADAPPPASVEFVEVARTALAGARPFVFAGGAESPA